VITTAVLSANPPLLFRELTGQEDVAAPLRSAAVSALRADGSLETIVGGLAAPEGMVVAADGRLLVAEAAELLRAATDEAARGRHHRRGP